MVVLSQPLPDQLDILRAADTTPQIQLLLDSSGSMRSGTAPTVCTYYPTAQSNMLGSFQSGSTWYLSRADQLKAALTGCRSATDGILDLWSDRVLFSVREFGGGRTGLLAPFDPSLSNLGDLETAVLNLAASGATPLAPAYRAGAAYFDSFFDDSNTERCRQNYLVVMSDGVGNSSGPVLFDFVTGEPTLTVHDANFCFGNVQSGCPPEPYLDAAAGYLVNNALGQSVDVLSNVDGTQPIRTYTIGFQAPTAADALLRAMAAEGDGRAFTATSYEQLSAAFEEIIASIIARSRVAFSAGNLQAQGLFSGNRLYISVFRPVEDGHWLGSTKKYCVLPESGLSGCLFQADPPGSTNYLVNLRPVDLWTGSDAPEANAGGTGEVMLNSIFNVSDVIAPPPSNPLNRRTLLSWRSGEPGYVRVHPDSLTPRDTWTGETCAHHALLNALHGFSEEVRDCSAGDLAPSTFDSWPIGDTVHGGTVLLQYTANCETSSDRCFAATVANDGMLHFYDAVTGRETSAVIPAELFRPNAIAHHHLAQRDQQPAVDTTRRYYFDGRLTLHHEDLDADNLIDANEEAYLIAGLGRAGRGYYLFDIRRFTGVPTEEDNPPRPLLADEATGFRNLRDTWAAPWTGLIEFSATDVRSVAVFPSGHVPELDAPLAPFAVPAPAAPLASGDSESRPHLVSCAEVGISDELCATPDPASFCAPLGIPGCTPGRCSACPLADAADCQAAGYLPPFCYDWPGAALLPSSLGIWVRYPLDVAAGPFRYESGGRRGRAYRVRFSRFDLQPADYIAFFDDEQNEVGRLSGSVTATVALSPWIYSPSFSMRLVTDGVNDEPALGYTISGVDVLRTERPAPSGEVHNPSIFIVDLDRWNAASPAGPPPYAQGAAGVFAAVPTGSDTRQADAIRVRITRECTGSQGVDELCIDRTSAPDLQWMVCPISAEPAVYTEGGRLRSIYIGDECGQIWRARLALDGSWSVMRLLRLNEADADGYTRAGGASKDYRKIFRRLDLVESTCTGRRATGVYFGTGNLQRPSAEDALEDGTVVPPRGTGAARDVVGVVWDSPQLPTRASLADLVNMTDTLELDIQNTPNGDRGWFLELREQERMLRDPLVFDRIAYFDVYRPTSAPSECVSAVGESRTLVTDNCTAEPRVSVLNPANADEARTAAQRPDSTIGGGFLVLTPPGEAPLVTLGQDGRGAAALPGQTRRRALRLFMWRL